MVTDSIKPQLEDKGYRVKLVEFTDYVTPNIALADGSLDVNCFQHKPYLKSFARIGAVARPHHPGTDRPHGALCRQTGRSEGGEGGEHCGHSERPYQSGAGAADAAGSGLADPEGGINPLKASEFDVVQNPHNLKLVLLEAAQLPARAKTWTSRSSTETLPPQAAFPSTQGCSLSAATTSLTGWW